MKGDRLDLAEHIASLDLERGRERVRRLFAVDRGSKEWEQALAELRAWSTAEWEDPATLRRAA